MKLLLLTVVISISAVLFSVTPAYAIALSFTQAGEQLDGDPILDIEPGANVSFRVFYNPGATPGSAAAANPLTNITYGVMFDSAELGLAGAVFGGTFAMNNLAEAGPGSLRITHGSGGAIAPGGPATFLDGLDFRVLNLNNDNEADFEFGPGLITNALGGGFVDITQIVEVQPRPVPEPSSMLLFGSGLLGMLGYYGWRRRRPEQFDRQYA